MKKVIVYLLGLNIVFSLSAMELPAPGPAQPAVQQEQMEPIEGQDAAVASDSEVQPQDTTDHGQRPAELNFFNQEEREMDAHNRAEEQQHNATISALRKELRRASKEERRLWINALREERKAYHEHRQQKAANFPAWLEYKNNAIKQLTSVQEAKIQADALVDRAKVWAKLLTDRKFAGLMAMTATFIFAGWHGTKVAANTLDRWLQIPPLAQKTSIQSTRQKIASYFSTKLEETTTVEDVILEPQLASRVRTLTTAIRNTAANDGYFRHYMLYGPPGTGKTMLAMGIAHDSGLEYIYFAASKLELYSIEEATNQLVHLFEYAKNYPKKCMIIMDEAEVLFGKREHMSDKTHKLLSTLLTYTGTESKDFMLMALTNKPGDFDAASLNRLGEKIKIDAPAHFERMRLLERYLEKHITSAARPINDTRPWYKRMVMKAPEYKPLVIESGALDQSVINDIVQKLDGFVGRDISDLCLAIRGAADATSNRTVTKALVYQELEIKCAQKQAELNGFNELGPVKG